MNGTIEQVQNLMEQHRWDEAADALRALLQNKEFVHAQAGGAYLMLMSSYIGALAAAQQKYNDALDLGISLLKTVNKREREMKEGVDLARVTNEINAMQPVVKS